MSKNPYLYTPSNETWIVGQIIFYSMALLFIPFLGYLYAILSFYMPLPYFNILLTGGAGILLGVFSIYIMILCKNRNKKNLLIGTSLSVFTFLLCAWMTYIVTGTTGPRDYFQIPGSLTYLASNYGLANIFNHITTYGFHTVFGFPLTGLGLIGTWIVEAGIIITIPFVYSYRHVLPPFSEKEFKHYKKENILTHFGRVASENVLIDNLNKRVIDTLDSMNKSQSMKGFSIVTLHTLPQ